MALPLGGKLLKLNARAKKVWQKPGTLQIERFFKNSTILRIHTLPPSLSEMFKGWRQILENEKSTVNFNVRVLLARLVAVKSGKTVCGFTVTKGKRKRGNSKEEAC